MKRLIAIACISLLAVFGASFGSLAQADTGGGTAPVAIASRSCGSGYTHAITPGGHKCLRAGQYCSHKRGYAKAYRKAGYRCNARGHLVRRRSR